MLLKHTMIPIVYKSIGISEFQTKSRWFKLFLHILYNRCELDSERVKIEIFLHLKVTFTHSTKIFTFTTIDISNWSLNRVYPAIKLRTSCTCTQNICTNTLQRLCFISSSCKIKGNLRVFSWSTGGKDSTAN